MTGEMSSPAISGSFGDIWRPEELQVPSLSSPSLSTLEILSSCGLSLYWCPVQSSAGDFISIVLISMLFDSYTSISASSQESRKHPTFHFFLRDNNLSWSLMGSSGFLCTCHDLKLFIMTAHRRCSWRAPHSTITEKMVSLLDSQLEDASHDFDVIKKVKSNSQVSFPSQSQRRMENCEHGDNGFKIDVDQQVD